MSSALVRMDMRAARRMSSALPRAPVTETSTRSRVSQGPADVVTLAVVGELLVHTVRHPKQGQLAQGDEVARPEVVGERRVDTLGRIDVAVGHPSPQRFRSHVDQLDLVGGADERVRDRLPLLDSRDASDDVVEGLEVLQVEVGDDVDAGFEQVLDVLPPLGVRGPGHVGVGQLVDQDERGLALDQPLRVHLLEGLAAVLDATSGKDLEVADLGVGLWPAMLLDPADHDVGAAFLATPPLVEHGVGLAHARRGSEVEAEGASTHACTLTPGWRGSAPFSAALTPGTASRWPPSRGPRGGTRPRAWS